MAAATVEFFLIAVAKFHQAESRDIDNCHHLHRLILYVEKNMVLVKCSGRRSTGLFENTLKRHLLTWGNFILGRKFLDFQR